MNMPEKDPLSYQFITYLWVIGLSSWGGVAGYIRKLKSGHSRFSFAELIGELFISAFVGIVTFFMCAAARIDPVLSAAFVGISGHMGSRAILVFEKIAQAKIDSWVTK
jgi:hypothetical protein